MTARSTDSTDSRPGHADSSRPIDISVVIPIFNERDNVERLVSEVRNALRDENYEIILVDDGSVDGSRAVVESLAAPGDRCRAIALATNCGQSRALMTGFDAARGSVIATLDADGQNDPADLPLLLEKLRTDESLAAVVGYRIRRADSRWKRLQSVIANRARDLITGDRVRDTGCSARVVRRQWLTGLARFDGMHRFIPTLLRSQGGVVLEMPVHHRARWSGRSKYGMWSRLGRGLRDAIRVRRLVGGGTTKPGTR